MGQQLCALKSWNFVNITCWWAQLSEQSNENKKYRSLLFGFYIFYPRLRSFLEASERPISWWSTNNTQWVGSSIAKRNTHSDCWLSLKLLAIERFPSRLKHCCREFSEPAVSCWSSSSADLAWPMLISPFSSWLVETDARCAPLPMTFPSLFLFTEIIVK